MIETIEKIESVILLVIILIFILAIIATGIRNVWIFIRTFHEMEGELHHIKFTIQEQKENMPDIIYRKDGKPYYRLCDKTGLIFYANFDKRPSWAKENTGVFAQE